MGNEFISLKQIARKALPRLMDELVFPNLIYKDFSEAYSDLGDTVQVRKPGVLTAHEFDESTGVSYEDIKESTVDVKVVVDDPDHPYVEPVEPPEDTSKVDTSKADTSTTGFAVTRSGDELLLVAPRQELSVTLYDMQGNLVRKKAFEGRSSLSVAGLPRGAYIVQVRNHSGKVLYQKVFR